VKLLDFFKLGDKFVTVIEDNVKVGDMAPEFTSAAQDWSAVNPVAVSKGKVAILSAVPLLDTDVCDRETCFFLMKKPPNSMRTASCVLSTKQKLWCSATGIDKVKVVSDVLESEMSLKYGLLVKERRCLCRAVFIVDREGKLALCSL